MQHEREAAYRAAGYRAGVALGDVLRQQVAARPHHPAVISGDRRLTYAELGDAVEARAAGLTARGIRSGDRLVLQLPNTAEYVITLFALFQVGARPVLALPSHRSAEIGYLARQSGAVGYVLPDEHLGFDHRTIAEEVVADIPALRHVLVAGEPGPGRTALDDVVAAPQPLAGPSADETALYLLSGGTTGMPKLIPRTHDDYRYNALASAQAAGVGPDTVFLAVLPVGHNFSLACPGLLGTMLQGGTTVLASTPDPVGVFRLVERERVTMVAVVPSILALWLATAAHSPRDLSSLRWVQVGAAKLTADVAAAIPDVLGAGVQQSFGMSEGLLVQTRPDDPPEVVLHTQGRPVSPADEVRIVDDADQDLPDGQTGHLLARGPYTIGGYLAEPEHNAAAFTSDGYFRTGDLVRRNADGTLVVTGRAKDLVNRGGELIAAAEVEEHLLRHPGIAAAAVVGLPDPRLGERSCAAVVPADGAPAPELAGLRSYLQERGLAAFKWPDETRAVPALPRTALGKTDKHRLREMLGGP